MDEQADPVRVSADLCLARAVRRDQQYSERSLPETMLQAFSVEPLAVGDARYVGREEQLTRLLGSVQNWRAGHSAMVAVTGPQGCGISSFLQQLPRQIGDLLGDSEVCRYGKLERRPYDSSDTLALLGAVIGCEQDFHSVDELIAYINGLSPRVFVIDNGHFLACRIMGANEAIRVFGAVMVSTQQSHLWVLGCEEFAWRRLSYVYRAERYFTHHIALSLLSEAELGQCLSVRLQAAGIVENPEVEEGSVPAMVTRHLPVLHKLSNGKPDLAFFYFLGSLPAYTESSELELQAVVPLDFSILKQLLSEEMFTLAEVAVHGQMTISDHRALFRIGPEESWLLLERLYHQCLLDKDETGEEVSYRLMPLYADVITRYLTNANYLY